MRAKSTFALITAFAVAGCAPLWIRSAPAGCESQIKPGLGAITIAGVEIPVGATAPVKIGNATYTPPQLQRLTDSAQLMEQYRLGQCGVLSTLERLSPQPVERIAQIAEGIARMNLELQRLFREIPFAKDPESKVRETEAAASQIETKALDKSSDKYGADTSLDTPIRMGYLKDLFESSTKNIVDAVAGVLRNRPGNQYLQPVELVVTGFSSGEHQMTTRMKANLLSDLQFKLQDVPKGQFVTVDVFGYADTTGTTIQNVALALKRAQHVASFIAEQQVLSKAKLRTVASGGAVEISPFGRQVRVVLSPVAYVS